LAIPLPDQIDSYYYDKSEIKQKSKNVVQVWVKRNLKNGAEGIEENTMALIIS